MSQFIAQLRSEAARLVEATDRSPMGTLYDGTATRDLYVAFLQETWHYVRFTSGTLLFAGERLNKLGQHGWLADVLIEKAGEEKGHDLWALADLEALGLVAKQVQATSASPAVAAYNAWTRFAASSPFPIAYLGVAYTLENLAVQRAGKAADALRQAARIPNIAHAVTYLVGHGEADVGHVAELEEVLERVKSPAEHDAVLTSAAATRLMYAGMVANLDEVARQSRHAA
ncbi:MAG: iron-containing redox enzyme family protein [Hyphomonadaceae bacterium]|jgi:pyrroloquinoline quinone (PQQ) biosynthesis protein C|nr:iron-containing redox enzyme family protein [Hyphomonadaceae bacterium]